ncbi:MFS transporter [Saccharothrix xinjiangensis]|uniref:MFS transporter n=1 Tax=Saccharothrix xinjiangensis TaxID=204798 RepID=A0ABV9Y4S4_9PSEU
MSALLVACGLGGVLGNWAAGRLTDRFDTRKLLPAQFGIFVVVLATLPLTTTTPVTAAVALFAWGALTWSVNPPIQGMLIDLAPPTAACCSRSMPPRSTWAWACQARSAGWCCCCSR